MLEDEADAAPLGRQARGVGCRRCTTAPASGCSRPAMTRSSVDLPLPLGPSSAVSEPSGTSTETSSSAVKAPKRLVTPCDRDGHQGFLSWLRTAFMASSVASDSSASTSDIA